MKYKVWLIALSALVLTACSVVQPELDEQLEATEVSEAQSRYVVVFNSNNVPRNAAQLITRAGGELIKTFPRVGVAIASSSNPDFAETLESKRGVQVVGAEGAFELPQVQEPQLLDEEHEWGDLSDLQWNIRRIKADEAWAVTTGSPDTVVAVIDTGIAWNHPDMPGLADLVHTDCFRTYTVLDECSDYPDLHWHGTFVAGLVAANFGNNIVGVAPNLGLASYNVFELFPDGSDNYLVLAASSSIWAAMLDAAERGFDIINLSLGGYRNKAASRDDPSASQGQVANWTAYQRIAEYVSRQGVTIVASSGNGGQRLNGPVDTVPAALPSVIAVSATGIRPEPEYPQEDAFDVRAVYSDHGAYIDLAAPGGDIGPPGTPEPFPAAFYLILGAAIFEFDMFGINHPDDIPECVAVANCAPSFIWAAGTSAAAPHVAAVAGMVKDENPHSSPRDIARILRNSAESIGHRQEFGHGMIDASAALRLAAR